MKALGGHQLNATFSEFVGAVGGKGPYCQVGEFFLDIYPIGLFVFLLFRVLSLYIFDISPQLYVYLVKKNIYTFCSLTVCPNDGVHCQKDVFQFHEVLFVNCCS